MWAQRSAWLTQSISFFGVLLTRCAHAVGLASAPGLGVAALALEAAVGRPMVIATAAAVASATRHPRRRPCPGLIMMLPSDGEPVGVIAERGVQMLADVVGCRHRPDPRTFVRSGGANTHDYARRQSTSWSLGSGVPDK